jgi:hypothetical protein
VFPSTLKTKKIKKTVILFLMIISITMLAGTQAFGQSIVGIWQVQNPDKPSVSENFLLKADKEFYHTRSDLVTYQASITCGTYEIVNGGLIFKFNPACGGGQTRASIAWIKKDVLGLVMDGYSYVLAISKSDDDNFFKNFIAGEILEMQQTPHLCVPCNGTGYCHVCNGKGRIYQGKVCPSCHGRGICPFCNGTGKKYYY